MGYKMQVKAAVVALVVCVFCFQPIKAEAAKMPVEVIYTGEDTIGIRLAYQVKEEIRKSNAYRLSSIDKPRIKIYLTTIDMASALVKILKDEAANQASVASVIYTLYSDKDHNYLHSGLATIGKDIIKEQAETIIASIEK